MAFVADSWTDTYVRQMDPANMAFAHPFVTRSATQVQVRTWWGVDQNDGLTGELWCNGQLMGSRSQQWSSNGDGYSFGAPAGQCELRLRQKKADAYTRYRVAIRYPR